MTSLESQQKTCTSWKIEAEAIRNNRNQFVRVEAQKINLLLTELKIQEELIERVLNEPVVNLVQYLNQGRITSYALVLIFASRTATIGLEYEMITQTNFTQALEKAKQCDQKRKLTGLKNWTFETASQSEYLPPLFGIPFSVKDNFNQKGFSSTLGIVNRYKHKQQKDGLVVQNLKKSGMIPFVRSNVAQMTMSYQSVNWLWGRVLNPWDKSRTAGGSSGGQGALIAARCSPIGLGTDIGGSVRIPAQFCGIFSLKPNPRRFSLKGQTYYSSSFTGQINIPSVAGVMGKSTEDLALWLKVITSPQYYIDNPDPYVKNVPFEDNKYNNLPKKMRIGYYNTLNFIKASKASQRAVHEVISALEKQGHQIIKIELPYQKQLIFISYQFFIAQGKLKAFSDILKGQQLVNVYKDLKNLLDLPKEKYNQLIEVHMCMNIQDTLKEAPRIGFILSKFRELSTYEYLAVSAQQDEFKEKFINLWKNNKLDVLITPGFGSNAQLHDFSIDIALTVIYTCIWNCLEMSAGIVPVTRVTEDEQSFEDQHNDNITKKLDENAKNSKGLPVGVQVIGLPFNQEIVLGTMKQIESLFPFYKENKFPL